MPKRVYKFISPEHGLSAVRDQRLKLSRIDELNDPFDLCSIDTSDPHIERVLEEHVRHFRNHYGLLCFSRNWDNLLLWSHYGASHAGLCLGFDIPDDGSSGRFDMEVRYQPNVLQIRDPADINYDLVNRLLRTKHESWSYEQESRMFVRVNDPADGHGLRWYSFGPQLKLTEVIVGSQCEREHIIQLTGILEKYCGAVACSWAYMRKDAFLLVRQSFPPPWFAEHPQ